MVPRAHAYITVTQWHRVEHELPLQHRRPALLRANRHQLPRQQHQGLPTSACLPAHATPQCTTNRRAQVPWEDLRYLFGEILYGGHIVEDWDRRLASAYLHKLFSEALAEGPMELVPGFSTPPASLGYKQVTR